MWHTSKKCHLMEASRTVNQSNDSAHSTNRRISTKYLNVSVKHSDISLSNQLELSKN